jgi:hypothetical protein
MKKVLVLVGYLLVVAHCGAATLPSPEHSALCVQALKLRADALGDRLDPGQPEVEAQLQTLLERGFAFIGSAYLQGLDRAQGDALLAKASQQLQRLPEAQLARRQAECEAEGARLLQEAGPFAQNLATRSAAKRIERVKRSNRERASVLGGGPAR